MCEKCKSPDPGAEFLVELLTGGIVIEIVEAPVIPDIMLHSMYWTGRFIGLMTRGECLKELAAHVGMPVIEVAMAIDRHHAVQVAKAHPKGWEVAEG